MITPLFFYIFATVTVLSGLMVISVRNPVNAVFCLILAFFNAAGLFVLMGAEFIAMLQVVVYVGAVAVLFLFVVMMLDIDFASMKKGLRLHLPVALLVGAVLLAELAIIFRGDRTEIPIAPLPIAPRGNIALIGDVLYTSYIYVFQIAGLILLVAMIGAITLTGKRDRGVKRQNIALQNSRRRMDTVQLVNAPSGEAPFALTTGILADAAMNAIGKGKGGKGSKNRTAIRDDGMHGAAGNAARSRLGARERKPEESGGAGRMGRPGLKRKRKGKRT